MADPMSPSSPPHSNRPSPTIHAALVVGIAGALFTWIFGHAFTEHGYLAESDLYEQFLPNFLAPRLAWSVFEFSGFPAFADPQNWNIYPLYLLARQVVHSWTFFVVSAYVTTTALTYAYLFRLTRSKTAAACAALAWGCSEAMLERTPHMAHLHVQAWLPLLFLAIEGILTGGRIWTVVGAWAVACCILAGHTQIVIYVLYVALAYAITAGLAERKGRAYVWQVSAMFVIGGLLTAYKSLPLAEATQYVARQEVNFNQFTGHANTPLQMLSALVPSIIHEGREAPTYVGIVTLVLAGIAVARRRTNWRITFWTTAAVIGLLLGMGEATPLASVAYWVPLYWKFRVVSRHLMFSGFGAAVLAGLALAALQRGEIPRTQVIRSAAAVLAALGAILLFLVLVRTGAEFENRPLPFGAGDHSLVVQTLIALTSALVVIGFAAGRYRRTWTLLVLLVLGADLLQAQPQQITPSGLALTVVPTAAADGPSVHAERLAAAAAPLHQRLLAPRGTSRDDVVPAAFARVWRIPIAGGYGPLSLARYATLAMMGGNGSVDPKLLSGEDRALDLLATRFIMVQRDEYLPAPPTFERKGITWSSEPIGLSVGRADCVVPHERTLSLPLPEEVDVASVAIVTFLRCADDVVQNTPLVTMTVIDPDGQRHPLAPLTAGVDTAEQQLSEESVRSRSRHQAPPRFDPDPSAPWTYAATRPLKEPVRGGRLELHDSGMNGWLQIQSLTFVDGAGRSHPQTLRSLLLEDRSRWQPRQQFRTSRLSDRGEDTDGHGETTYDVYENTRALPRAWVAPRVLPLSERDLFETIRHAQLPDGTAFDPATTALIDAEDGASVRRLNTRVPGVNAVARAAEADIQELDDRRASVRVSSEDGGFLVLSDVWYPGWRARIDGVESPVVRTDGALRGVALPPGPHLVEFEFAPTSERLGLAGSLVGLAAGGILLVGAWRRPQANETAVRG